VVWESKKEVWGSLSKEEYFGGRIIYRMEALLILLALELPNPKRKSVQLVPERPSKTEERSGIPRLHTEVPQGGPKRWVRPTIPFHLRTVTDRV